VEEARQAPGRVMREMHAMATAMAADVETLMVGLKKGPAGAGKRSAAPAGPFPPSSNTGGKVPNKPAGRRGEKS